MKFLENKMPLIKDKFQDLVLQITSGKMKQKVVLGKYPCKK